MPSLSSESVPLPLHSFTKVMEEILTDVIHHPPAEAQQVAEQMTAEVIYQAAHSLDVDVDEPSTYDLQHAYQVLSDLHQLSITDEEIATQLAVAAQSLLRNWLDVLAYAILTETDKLKIMEIVSKSLDKKN